MEDEIKKVNAELPVEVHKAVKKRAIDDGVTMKVWIAEAVKGAVEGKAEAITLLLKNVVEREMTLDILRYISELGDEEKVNAEMIAEALGYPREKVEEILREIVKKGEKDE